MQSGHAPDEVVGVGHLWAFALLIGRDCDKGHRGQGGITSRHGSRFGIGDCRCNRGTGFWRNHQARSVGFPPIVPFIRLSATSPWLGVA